ncbi:Uncharacterized protein Adt_40303 [Abeliophyllum distichum]|uniref:Retrotransposon gag domain-containing protein n=1 Tax=Abeliophyllum distichum TaxID=126358 RepID=A0ABD1Q7L8_9LAMI
MDTRQKVTVEHLRKIDKDLSDLGLAYSTLNGKIDSSDKILKSMCCKQDKMEELMQDMNSKYESLVAMMAILNVTQNEQKKNKQVERRSSKTEMSSGDMGNKKFFNCTKLPKIDFPIFGGENPREWVRKANKYFQLHNIPDEMKMGIVEMYLKGRADIWFHGFQSSNPTAEWALLTTEVCRRFAETTGKKMVETFSKIR